MRDHFDPKARWRGAINSALALGRLKRAGSDRSTRLAAASRDASRDGSDDERESAGWRTPIPQGDEDAEGEKRNGGGKGEDREGNALLSVPTPRRTASTGSSSSSSVDETNENVRIHPPAPDTSHPQSPPVSVPDVAPREPSPSSAHTLKRENGKPHDAAVHNIPQQTQQKHVFDQDEDHFNFSMPGSFNFAEPGFGRGGERHGNNRNAGGTHEHGHEHVWVSLFQKLGLKR